MVRLSPPVRESGDAGLIPEIIKAARKNGKSPYIGDGANRWPAVHVRDAAKLFRLALERGIAGNRYHAVAEEGIPFRTIAEKISEIVRVPVDAETPEAAGKHFGWLSTFAASDNPCSSDMTRSELGWQPSEASLLKDWEADHYCEA